MKTLKRLTGLTIFFILAVVNVKANLHDFNPYLTNKITFQVVIENVETELPTRIISLFNLVNFEENIDANLDYYLGEFKTPKKATIYQNALKRNGIKNVKIAAYFRKRAISMEDAYTLLNDQNKFEDPEYKFANKTTIPIDDAAILLDIQNFKADFYYTLQVNSTATVELLNRLKKRGNIHVRATGEELYNYSAGNFQYYTEATKALQNLPGVFITAYVNKQRISIARAQLIEQKLVDSVLAFTK